MSLLKFQPECLAFQCMRKISPLTRINLYVVDLILARDWFDRKLDRKSLGTITLNELHQLYKKLENENDKKRCFDNVVVTRLRSKYFNEITNLPIVLEGEIDHFSAAFFDKFLDLLDKTEGDLLIAFICIKSFVNLDVDRYNKIISRKWERGQKLYFLVYCHPHYSREDEFHEKSLPLLPFMSNIFFYVYWNKSDGTKQCRITINTATTSRKKTTKAMIDIMNEDSRLEECQKYLVDIFNGAQVDFMRTEKTCIINFTPCDVIARR